MSHECLLSAVMQHETVVGVVNQEQEHYNQQEIKRRTNIHRCDK